MRSYGENHYKPILTVGFMVPRIMDKSGLWLNGRKQNWQRCL